VGLDWDLGREGKRDGESKLSQGRSAIFGGELKMSAWEGSVRGGEGGCRLYLSLRKRQIIKKIDGKGGITKFATRER